MSFKVMENPRKVRITFVPDAKSKKLDFEIKPEHIPLLINLLQKGYIEEMKHAPVRFFEK